MVFKIVSFFLFALFMAVSSLAQNLEEVKIKVYDKNHQLMTHKKVKIYISQTKNGVSSDLFVKESGKESVAFEYERSKMPFLRVKCDDCLTQTFETKDYEDLAAIELEVEEIDEIAFLKNAPDKFFFKEESNEFLPISEYELETLLEVLKSTSINIKIAGHSDEMEDSATNKELSHQRALAVYNYLVQNGIDADRLTVESYGSTQPVVSDVKSNEQRGLNMRVEIMLAN
ncbi:MAG: OmpA family protein [bacterium]|nr:OmpA family protein [bacterium]